MRRWLVLVILLVPCLTGFQVVPPHSVRGQGDVGDWELLWSFSEVDGVQNRFRQVVDRDRAFPVAWRRVTDRSGDRLAFFNRDGDMEETIELSPHDGAVASRDGRSYLTWTEDPVHRNYSSFRFVSRDAIDLAWEATAKGAPTLLAPDGSMFVIATREDKMDLIHSGQSETVGSLQVVGASGDVRGEFPIFPFYARLTGDERHIVLLHNRELVVLDRDGNLAWNREVSLDQMCNREGVTQLAAAGGVIAVGGTGGRDGGRRSLVGIHPVRRGAIEVFDDDGRLLWRDEQPEDSDLWFQMTAAISADGRYLATCHSASREIEVRLYEARSGKLLWSHDTRRRDGCRALSITGEGDLVVLSHGDTRTTVTAWDRAGDVVWEGHVPFSGRVARIAEGDLLVSDQWIVQLRPVRSES
jgi:hypothetical protein